MASADNPFQKFSCRGNREMGWCLKKAVGRREECFQDRRYESVFSGW